MKRLKAREGKQLTQRFRVTYKREEHPGFPILESVHLESQREVETGCRQETVPMVGAVTPPWFSSLFA